MNHQALALQHRTSQRVTVPVATGCARADAATPRAAQRAPAAMKRACRRFWPNRSRPQVKQPNWAWTQARRGRRRLRYLRRRLRYLRRCLRYLRHTGCEFRLALPSSRDRLRHLSLRRPRRLRLRRKSSRRTKGSGIAGSHCKERRPEWPRTCRRRSSNGIVCKLGSWPFCTDCSPRPLPSAARKHRCPHKAAASRQFDVSGNLSNFEVRCWIAGAHSRF